MRISIALTAVFSILRLAVACAPKGHVGGSNSQHDSAASCTVYNDVDIVNPVTACFLESSSFTRPPGGRFTIDDINSTLCTHVVYLYADLNEATYKIDVGHEAEYYGRLAALKEVNPNLKITVATGGWEVGAEKYSKMASSKDARDAFIASVVDLLRQYKLDGLDIDWRDPGTRGGLPEDKANYIQLCKELKQEFLMFGWQLTVMVTGRIVQLDIGYDLSGLAEHTDYFYLVTYDYHGAWDGYMGHTAPLYPRKEESGSQRELNVNFTVSTILSRGIPANKLVMGITLYAHIYHFTDVNNKGFGATTIWKHSLLGPYTKDAGKMGYNELCEILKSEGSSWTDDWQDEHKVPYISRSNISISYDNERSIDIRINFAEAFGLRGVFVLAVNLDDFSGRCGEGPYPLLTQINSKISTMSSFINRAKACALGDLVSSLSFPSNSGGQCSADNDANVVAPVTACFLESSSFNLPPGGRFSIEDINSTLCTHVVYLYAALDPVTHKLNLAQEARYIERLTVLKEDNPNLKITVATGGWEAGTKKYSMMAASREARVAFISSVVDLLRLYTLDGLDIDWRDPGAEGGILEDKENYVQLCKELKQEFIKFGWQLTVLVSGRISQIDRGYDLPGLAESTDYFYLVTYDYHGPWDGSMSHTAPLYHRRQESESQRELNVNATVSTILSQGIPASRLVMGITLYAYIYTYEDITRRGFGEKTIPKGDFVGPYTKDWARMGNNELCEMLRSEGSFWIDDWQAEHKVPYISRNDITLLYENERSIDNRIKFAKSLGLRGAFVLAVNADDFTGRCGQGRYPLLTLINSKISAISSSSRWEQDCSKTEEPVSPVVACFLESWSANRPSFGQFSIEHINATLCTHVVYCYAKLNQITHEIEISDDGRTNAGTFERLRTLKTVNPHLKITVAIGGSGEPSSKYSNMVADRATRSIFIASAVELLRKHQLDGLVLDWRDPATKGGRRPDKMNYVMLCQALRQEFRKHGWQLTVTISSRLYNLNAGYDLEGLARHADYFYVLTYEYHGFWETVTGHSAPLYPRHGETGHDLEYNVNFTVSTILSRGVPASKIVMGIFLYGKIYRLENPFNIWTGARAIKNNDFVGPYTREQVTLGYNEVCEILHEKGVKWNTFWDDEHRVTFIYKNDIWISYENERSIINKMDFSETLNLRGAFIWAVDSDDFRGRCGAGPYPLLTQVHNRMQIAAEKRKPTENSTASIVACFLDSWSVYRTSNGQFNVEDIDVSLCTHIIYCFAGLDETTSTIVSLDPDYYVQSGAFERVVQLKKKKPSLVITVSIGGYAEGSEKFSMMSAKSELRRSFIASVVKFLKRTGFDGMDLAWDSPAHRGGKPEDKANFVQLCKELKSAFSRTGWTFTVSLTGKGNILDQGYDLPAIVNEVDLFYVLAYDYHGFWDGVTGHPSPLKPVAWEEGRMEDSVEFSVLYFTFRSVPTKKIVLVLNFFGRTFKLKEASDNSLGAPAHKLGFSGPYSQDDGFIGYNEICEIIIEEGSLWTLASDPVRGLPYMFKDDLWMAYDDISTIGKKVSLAKQLELAGVGVWTVSTDDFRGHCGRGKFPLLTQVNKILGKIAVDNSTKSPFNISAISGIWCSIAEQANVTVEVLQCGGFSDVRDCIKDNEVPPQTVVFASCWGTTDLVMKCLPDGYWIPLKDFPAVLEDRLAVQRDTMKLLCQPHQLNSLICGRRPRYQRTSALLDLAIFFEPKIRWPWVVKLYEAERYICCACIVSVHYLLTAAHCVTRSREANTDTLDVNRLIVKMTSGREAKVSDIQLHPEYRNEKNQLVNDIAILKLSEPLTFHSELYPACVNFKNDLPQRTAVAFSLMPDDDNLFQYTAILQTPDSECSASSGRCSRPLDRSLSQFCGHSQDGVSVLQPGSSGGPFMQDLSSRSGEEQWAVTGVASFSSKSPECFQHTVYTAVHSVRTWMRDITQRLFEDSSITSERE